MRNILAHSSQLAPLAFFLVILIAFGPLAGSLGFYWDDLPTLNYLHTYGPETIENALGGNRPLLAWMYRLTTRLCGYSAERWQWFSLFWRWASAAAFWVFLRSLWPRRGTLAAAAGLLFALYPGFGQQPVAMIYSHYHLVLAAFFFSLAAGIWAVRRPRWAPGLQLAGVLSAAFTLFSIEYYFGLELLRPLALYLVLGERELPPRERLKKTFFYWLPYGLIVLAFAVWRTFLVHAPLYAVELENTVRLDLRGVIDLLTDTIPQAVYETGLLAWQQAMRPEHFTALYDPGERGYARTVLVAAAVVLLALWWARGGPGERSRRVAWQVVGLGAAALVSGALPFWLGGMPVRLEFPENRFNLALNAGSSLLVAGLIALLVSSQRKRVAILAVIVGFAAGYQYQVSQTFAAEWKAQKDFLWQLAWRAPSLEPGTLILTQGLPFRYSDDEALISGINLLYDPQRSGSELRYGLLDLGSRAAGSLEYTPAELLQNGSITQQFRSFSFTGSLSQALAVHAPENQCLRALDPGLAGLDQRMPESLYALSGFSDLGTIAVDELEVDSTFLGIFGSPPEGSWCHLYEQAELAVQKGDWGRVARLGDRALSRPGIEPPAVELVPFIRGYLNSGQVARAEALAEMAVEQRPTIRPLIEQIWEEVNSIFKEK